MTTTFDKPVSMVGCISAKGISSALVRALFIGVLILTLNACAIGGHQWREEVALPNGETLIIQRIAKLGSPLDQEIQDLKFGPPIIGHVLSIPLPGTASKIKWEGDRSLTPLAIGLAGPSIYLAASPYNCPAYERWGRPSPPYVFFKGDESGWVRIQVGEFPVELTRANLLVSPRPDKIQSGYVDAYTKERSNIGIGDALRTIYRTGNKGFESCLLRLEQMDEFRRNKK